MRKLFLFGIISLMLVSLFFSSGCENNVGKAYDVLTAGNQTSYTGNLYVSSIPTGANIYVDNVLKGTTPKTVTGLTVGNHAVKVTKAGYNNFLVTKYVYANKTTNLNMTLIPIQNQTGNLYVSSIPTGANIYVDNVLKGTTPKTVTGLTVGNHAVKVTKAGYNNFLVTKYVYANKTTNLNMTLIPIQNQTGNLYVSSIPTGANIYVDNVLKGTTPKTVTGLAVGNHIVKVTKSGYSDFSVTKYISAGQTANLNMTLIPIQNQTY